MDRDIQRLKLLSTQEASDILGVHRSSLASLDIRFIRIGRRRLYSVAEIERWIREKEEESGAIKLSPAAQPASPSRSRGRPRKTAQPSRG
ncbi:helix-turn-helix domain-containing protein [Nitrospirillum amazonense]|uniref:helix-turn-helix domain-containing protein n=1 Tax=Nitrospirillum amazonense TaxID=28077 RepID=UPI00398C0E93